MYLSVVQVKSRYFSSKFIKNECDVTAIEQAIVAAGISVVIMFIFDTSDSGLVCKMLIYVFRTLGCKLKSIID